MVKIATRSVSVLKRFPFLLAAALLVLTALLSAHKAYATTMTFASVLETNMNSSGTSSFMIDFKAGANDSASTLTITWPGGFTVNATQTVATAACTSVFSGANALPSTSTLTAAGSGQVVTISNVDALVSGTQYCAELTSSSAVTNNSSTGNYTVSIADGTDGATVGIDIISNDQIVVSATVLPTFTLSFGGNTDSLGTLTKSALATSSGVALSVTTNAVHGWGLWAEDSNAGLHSVNASKTIASVSTGSNHAMNGGIIGTEAYALGVTTANATANYADAGGTTGGGLSSSAFNEIASANAAGDNVGVTVKELADVSGTTPAASDYSDTITIVGAGSF
jgi:hypothetical protein